MTAPLLTNKEIVRRTWEGLFNEGRLDLADQYISPAFTNHAAPGMPQGPAAFKQIVMVYRTGFPDVHLDIQRLVAEDDQVVMVNQLTGTHQGQFMGVAPSGKPVSQLQMHLIRLANGQIIEHTAVRDDLTLMEQIGGVIARS